MSHVVIGQELVEILFADNAGSVRIGQDLLEILYVDGTPARTGTLTGAAVGQVAVEMLWSEPTTVLVGQYLVEVLSSYAGAIEGEAGGGGGASQTSYGFAT